jgi:hypothetical protein
MMAVKTPQFRVVYREARDIVVGDVVHDQPVDAVKRYRSRNESFRRVRLTYRDGTVRTFRERFRVPTTVTA